MGILRSAVVCFGHRTVPSCAYLITPANRCVQHKLEDSEEVETAQWLVVAAPPHPGFVQSTSSILPS